MLHKEILIAENDFLFPPSQRDFDTVTTELRARSLESAAKTEDKVEGALLLNVVVGEGAAVLELLAGEDQPLLVRGDSLLVLDLLLDVVDGVAGLDIEGDGLSREGLDEDLHVIELVFGSVREEGGGVGGVS